MHGIGPKSTADLSSVMVPVSNGTIGTAVLANTNFAEEEDSAAFQLHLENVASGQRRPNNSLRGASLSHCVVGLYNEVPDPDDPMGMPVPVQGIGGQDFPVKIDNSTVMTADTFNFGEYLPDSDLSIVGCKFKSDGIAPVVSFERRGEVSTLISNTDFDSTFVVSGRDAEIKRSSAGVFSMSGFSSAEWSKADTFDITGPATVKNCNARSILIDLDGYEGELSGPEVERQVIEVPPGATLMTRGDVRIVDQADGNSYLRRNDRERGIRITGHKG